MPNLNDVTFEIFNVEESQQTAEQTSSQQTAERSEGTSSCSIPESDEPLLKQQHRNRLSFIRHHYLNIILFLSILVFVMFCLWIGTIIIKFGPVVIESKQLINQDPAASKDHDTIWRTDNMSVIDNINTQSVYLEGIKCKAAMCVNYTCIANELSFYELKRYTCCKCIPSMYHLIRISEDVLFNRYSIILQIDKEVRDYSPYDLRGLSPLPNLLGTWSIVREGESAYWLRYGAVRWSRPPDIELKGKH